MTERLQQPSDSGHRSARRRSRAGGSGAHGDSRPGRPWRCPPRPDRRSSDFPAEETDETYAGGTAAADEGPDILPFHRVLGVLKRVDRVGPPRSSSRVWRRT